LSFCTVEMRRVPRISLINGTWPENSGGDTSRVALYAGNCSVRKVVRLTSKATAMCVGFSSRNRFASIEVKPNTAFVGTPVVVEKLWTGGAKDAREAIEAPEPAQPATAGRAAQPDAVLAELRRASVGTLIERMGIELVEVGPQRVVGTMPVAGNTQPHGLLHGGASVAGQVRQVPTSAEDRRGEPGPPG